MEVLFVKPIYGGAMIDQTLLLNRRQFEQEFSKAEKKRQEEELRKQEERDRDRRK